jgi:GNAT superfamily N-acetyltransferase
MRIQVRPADLSRDRLLLINFLRQHLTADSNSCRFDWLYAANPCGAARAWLALDLNDGSLVGAAAAFPRRLNFSGEQKMGWVLGDFCIDPGYRSLGPAMKLQRACLDGIGAPSQAFCYDFPSQTMLAIYTRLGMAQTGALVRWAKPLGLPDRVKKMFGSRVLRRAMEAPAKSVLSKLGWKGDRRAADLQLQVGRCEEEFNILNQQVCGQPGIFTDRTAEYLNWRYLGHPLIKHEILAARRDGALVGYAVFAQAGDQARIVDLCSLTRPGLVAHMLARVLDLLGSRGMASVSMNVGSAHPWSPVFERVGFRRREASPVVTYAPGNGSLFQTSRSPWYLMQGERDS